MSLKSELCGCWLVLGIFQSLLSSQSPGFVVAGGRGCGDTGDATWGSWAQDYRGNATSNYFLTLSRLGARRNLYIAHHTLSAHCEPEENGGNVTPWSDLIWINSRTQTIHSLNSWETLTCRGGASHKVVTNVSRSRCHRCPAWLYDDQGNLVLTLARQGAVTVNIKTDVSLSPHVLARHREYSGHRASVECPGQWSV